MPNTEHLTPEDAQKIIDDWKGEQDHCNPTSLAIAENYIIEIVQYAFESGHLNGLAEARGR